MEHYSIAQKLEALMRLQSIDSKLDEIIKIQGDLPNEVQDLEDELAGYETRIKKYSDELAKANEEIKQRNVAIAECRKQKVKYEEQQLNVRNNREYDALTKEVENMDLDIQLHEKSIRETGIKVDTIKEQMETTKTTMSDRKKDLDAKKGELQTIIGENEVEQRKLEEERVEAVTFIEDRLYRSYTKIRTNSRNGLAVVAVKRDACGGCFNMVPPQRQADVREKKKLIVCEHCGRVFADVEDVVEVEKVKKPVKRRTSALSATALDLDE